MKNFCRLDAIRAEWYQGHPNDSSCRSSALRPVFLLLPLMISCLAACAHEAENTGVENSSVITLPLETYAFETPYTAPNMFPTEHAAETSAASFDHRASLAAGSVSRFQRHIIVAGGEDNPNASPQSQYFDDVMDHLEYLMKDEIAKNNKIAVLQEKIPGYEF